jgi:acetyl esterase/lipase
MMAKRTTSGLLALALSLAILGASCTTRPTSRQAPSGCADGVSDPATTTWDVAYGPEDAQRADIHPACTERAIGTVMYVHGGGYTSGDRSEAQWPEIRRLRGLGWVVVSIDYRLATSYPWPAQTRDAQRAIAWWRGGAADSFGAPVAPLVGVGWSAGGHIADWPSRPPSTSATALFGTNPPLWRLVEASTTTYVDPSDPPLLHIHAENDSFVPVSQALLLDEVIQLEGDPSKHAVALHPSCGHSLACFTPELVDPFLAGIAAG